MSFQQIAKHSITYTESRPPPGRQKGEPMDTSLNRLGKVLLLKVPVISVKAVHIINVIGGSTLTADDIISRLSIYRLNEAIDTDRLILYVKSGNRPRMITSNDIMIKESENLAENKTQAPVVKNVEIMMIPANSEVHVELIMGIGTGETDGSNFTIVTKYSYNEVSRGVYDFSFELVKGFYDGLYALNHAKRYLEEGIEFNAEEFEDFNLDEIAAHTK